MIRARTAPRVLYGGLFLAAIPAVLVAWAMRANAPVAQPPSSLVNGVLLLLLGLSLVLAGAFDPPRLSFPRGEADSPGLTHRIAVFVWVLIPWTLTWFGTQALGRPPGAFGTALPFEQHWPVWQWTEAIYLSTYLFIPLTALGLRTQGALRRFAVTGAVATLIVTICWLTIPVVAVNRPFAPSNLFGRLLAFEQGHSVGVAAFPAFHVLWSLIAADAWVLDGRLRQQAWPGPVAWIWAVLIVASCLTTAMHTVIDEAAAALLFFVVRARR
jgi:PAP2 superfamily protein